MRFFFHFRKGEDDSRPPSRNPDSRPPSRNVDDVITTTVKQENDDTPKLSKSITIELTRIDAKIIKKCESDSSLIDKEERSEGEEKENGAVVKSEETKGK